MVTIILTVSRDTYLKRIFAQLDFLECNEEETNLFCYVDGNQDLYEKARNLTVNSKFKDRLCVYRSKGLGSTSHFYRRRKRIAQIHNEIRSLIADCKYVLSIEDDTLFPIDGLQKLLKIHRDNPFAGFVSGLQLGRWGFASIGAWKFDDIYEPTLIESIENGKGIEQVDASGLYFCLTRKENYINNDFQPFEDILGPDVSFGINLRKQGLNNYVDHSIKCAHLTKKGDIKFDNTDIVRVKFDKMENEKTGWKLARVGG